MKHVQPILTTLNSEFPKEMLQLTLIYFPLRLQRRIERHSGQILLHFNKRQLFLAHARGIYTKRFGETCRTHSSIFRVLREESDYPGRPKRKRQQALPYCWYLHVYINTNGVTSRKIRIFRRLKFVSPRS
jgi:hypothetical protein